MFMNNTLKLNTLARMWMILIGIVSVLILFIVSTQPAYAQGTIGVKIQPATVEERTQPGESHSFTLKVTNTSNSPQTYYFSVKNIESMTDTGAPIFAKEGEVTGLEISDWVVLPREPLYIEGGARAEVLIEINVPNDATPGGHFGGIFVSMQPTRPETSGTGIGFEAGSLISMQVDGDVFEEASIREFSSGRTLYGKPEVDFSVKVDNLGNVLVRPRGVIEIIDMFGTKIETLVINDSAAGVFPGTQRDFIADWSENGFRMGRYEAVASLTYGLDVRRTISKSLTFWILPMNVLGPILGGLLVVILIIYFGVRSHIRRKMDMVHRARPGGVRHVAPHRNQTSRLTVVTIALLVFTIIFLVGLFLAFA